MNTLSSIVAHLKLGNAFLTFATILLMGLDKARISRVFVHFVAKIANHMVLK